MEPSRVTKMSASDEGALEGSFFHPDAEGKKAAWVTLDHQRVLVRAAGREYSYPPLEFTPSIGGANNQLLFLTHVRSEKIIVCLPSGPGLKAQVARLPDDLRLRIKELQNHRRKTATVALSAAVAFLAIIGIGGYFLLNQAVDVAAELIPQSAEDKIGDLAIEGLLTDPEKYKDTDAQRQLEALLAKIKPGLPPPYQDITVYIQKNDNINAFALPGGHIVFNSELLEKARTPEEILGVAAHEMAHVTERHGLKGILRSLGLYMALTLLVGDFSGLIAVLAENSSLLLQQSYSRDTEAAADRLAFDLLWTQGIDPRGIAGFFEMIKKEEDRRLRNHENLKKVLGYLSTHPDTDERIRNIQEMWEQRGSKAGEPGPEPVTFDMAKLKAALREL